MKIVRLLVLRIAIALVAVPTGATPGLSQDVGSAEALQEARTLVSLMSGSITANPAAGQTWPLLESEIRNKFPRIDAATLAELRNEYERMQIGYAAEVVSEAPRLYAQHFTAQELRDIAAFYRTPAGAKLLTVLPQAMSELVANELPRLQAMQQRLTQSFERILQARGYTR